MVLQSRIPAALAAIHNFIMDNDNENFLPDFRADADTTDPLPGLHVDVDDIPTGPTSPFTQSNGNLSTGIVSDQEYEEALKERDNIAEAMWLQYQEVLHTRADEDAYLDVGNVLDGIVDEEEDVDDGEVE
ncbi:hypothetical protein PQX77_020599 [Marasmius sp. AFHP31]|nr:hypothetical protein PQX77_020599 [Marasmius sp. AFHP31]